MGDNMKFHYEIPIVQIYLIITYTQTPI